MDDLSLSAMILAGGQSSRMGRDKALIEWHNRPLIQRVYEVAQCCARPVYVVTPWIERYQPYLPEPCHFIQELPLPGQDSTTHGPLVGFAQGLQQVQTEWVLLLACDLPYLDASVVQTALPQLGQVPAEAIALLPKQTKGWEPLCGFYRQRGIEDLMGFIQAGGRSFQQWLARHPVQEWQLADPRLLFNCNTPADLEQARQQSYGRAEH